LSKISPRRRRGPPAVGFVSLGCPKALVDSERILTRLRAEGYAIPGSYQGADLVVVNTCGFIDSAVRESLDAIGEALQENGRVIVTGCLGVRSEAGGANLVRSVHPKVLAVTGPQETDAVLQAIHEYLPQPHDAFTDLVPPAGLKLTPRHYAYLKISEGCDRLCTFCAIPKMRGKHITKPIEEVLREAHELAADGVRELLIVAQDSTYYGMDLYGKVRFAELLRQLEQVDGIEWIRILYAYPEHISDELLSTLSASKKIVPYIDMPLQHINDRVLKRMQRRVNRQSTEDLIGKLRKSRPNLAFRTTFIVGFPGETDAEFQELCDFVQNAAFERAGVFTYSFEPDTPAAKLDGHVPEELKQERRNRLMEIQQAVAFAWSARQVGREIEALVDGPDPEVPNHFHARGHADAPEIDGLVRLKGKHLKPGDIVKAKVTAADGYDLLARAIGSPR